MTARTGDVPAAEFNASQAAIGELMELLAKQDAELAALKRRRCDRCTHYGRPDVLHGNMPAYGACLLPLTDPAAMEIAGGKHAETEIELLVDADHYCAAWEPR